MTDLAGWNGFTQAVSMIELCIAGYCLYKLVNPFLQSTKAALAAGGTFILTMLGFYIMPLHIDAFMTYALGSLMSFLVMCGLERRNYIQKAFFVITWFSLRWFTAAIAELLYDKLYNLATNTMWYQRNPPMHLQFAVYFGVCVFYLTMVFMITNGAVYYILKNYMYKY